MVFEKADTLPLITGSVRRCKPPLPVPIET